MKHYRVVTTIHHKTKVEFVSKVEELHGTKPSNVHFAGKIKSTYYNYFDTPEQAERFQNINLKASQIKGQVSMFDKYEKA